MAVETRKIHIRLSTDLHRRLRIRCAELDVTIQDYVERAIKDSLGGRRSKTRPKRVRPKKGRK